MEVYWCEVSLHKNLSYRFQPVHLSLNLKVFCLHNSIQINNPISFVYLYLLESDSDLFTLKEKCFDEIHSAFLQLPAYSSQTGESSVVETVEFHSLTVLHILTVWFDPTLNLF